jgi:CheY-specific phosphatase CheX
MMNRTAQATSTSEFLSNAVLSAASAVFEDNGITLDGSRAVSASDATRSYPAAIIGFAGPKVAGTLSLVVPWEILEKSHPGSSAVREDLLDWLRELSNLLLGKLKTTFCRHGLAINMGLPTSAVGQTIAFDTSRKSFMAYVLSLGESEAILLFDAEVDGGVEWTSEPEPPQTSDMLFF